MKRFLCALFLTVSNVTSRNTGQSAVALVTWQVQTAQFTMHIGTLPTCDGKHDWTKQYKTSGRQLAACN